jgi:hypothetical protein
VEIGAGFAGFREVDHRDPAPHSCTDSGSDHVAESGGDERA